MMMMKQKTANHFSGKEMQSICISLIDDDERGRLQTVTSLFALDLAFIPVKLLWRPVRQSVVI